ncbi:hypothetical protein QQS21_001964 [Conoideocrella luteorostrata]|uniref:Protein kinase domain-containing protein n=1 Tax=Conoideocrella luteorostrata TaxID=1105319 RepID=A0AAJ0G1N3_9HYPO|nr:hypothetical protein QQS21_001964 [Conoideocrella luteorostrata]
MAQTHHEHPVRAVLRRHLLPVLEEVDDSMRFIPQNTLYEVFRIDTIKEIIGGSTGNENLGRVEPGHHILGHDGGSERLRILATLVYIERPDCIHDFIRHGICDQDLPLKERTDCFNGLGQRGFEEFSSKQYLMLAPILTFDPNEHVKFDRRCPMPYLEPLDWSEGMRGGGGVVAKIQIHKHHQDWRLHPNSDYQNNPYYAVKKLETQNAEEFERERSALMRFSLGKTGDPHLIKLLFSYEKSGNYFFVFPWAKHNLHQFWKSTQSDAVKGQRSTWQLWLIKQCLGLTKGLRKVHHHESSIDVQREGRHGDIKPANILYFPDQREEQQGRLVLADLGLTRFHSEFTQHYTLAHRISCTLTYRPPEVDDDYHSKVNQSYDIWTLACVFIEFITWHLLGYEALGYEAIAGRGFLTPDGQERQSFSTVRLVDDDRRNQFPQDKFFNRVASRVGFVRSILGHSSPISSTFVLKSSVTKLENSHHPLPQDPMVPGTLEDDDQLNVDLNLLQGEIGKPQEEVVWDGRSRNQGSLDESKPGSAAIRNGRPSANTNSQPIQALKEDPTSVVGRETTSLDQALNNWTESQERDAPQTESRHSQCCINYIRKWRDGIKRKARGIS